MCGIGSNASSVTRRRDTFPKGEGKEVASLPKEERVRVQFTFPSGEGGPLAVDEVLTENSIQYLSVSKGNGDYAQR